MLAVSRGNADNSGGITISDAVYITNYVFSGGPPLVPHHLAGDCDCNGLVTIVDAVYLFTYINGGGPPPPICFEFGE